MKERTYKHVFFLILVLMISYVTHAQKVWEPISLQGLKWSDNPNLNITLNSRGDLEAWNSNTEKSKDDNWYKEIISMSIPSSIIDTIKNSETGAVRITFRIRNKHDEPNNNVYYVYSNKNLKLKRDKYTGVYWGYHIKFTEGEYLKRYFNDYCIKPSYSPTTLLRHRLYSSTNNLWLDQEYIGKQNVSIEICNESIKIFEDFNLIYYTSNTAIDELQIVVGSAALVVVEDLKVELLTLYGQAETFILTGNRDFDNGNYLDATINYSKAIDNGYENYEIYYQRATSYYKAEFYASALEDYTKALSYKKTEDAYFYRGMCKLQQKDIPSALEDLKLGGAKGITFAKELELNFASKGVEVGEIESPKYDCVGTGFIIDTKGYIATNYHVIENATSVNVHIAFKEEIKEYCAKVVVVDKNNDLAIIKIDDSKFSQLPSVPYIINRNLAEVGTSVFAMGYPEILSLGKSIKVTNGIISSKTGYQGDITCYQISAPIHPGNSGGPLIDETGCVIGICNAGVKELQNVGYAIKSSYLNNLIDNSPEQITLQEKNQLGTMSLPEKIKKISPYVVLIEAKSKKE